MDHNITVTDNVFKRIEYLAAKANNSNLMLRIQVSGGGCSGFSYNYSMTEESTKDDIIFKKDNIRLLIDPTSLPFLSTSTIDFIEELGSSYLSIKNPNATAKCGCGNSFAV
jgi:iron-sulfur cluster insertion protein